MKRSRKTEKPYLMKALVKVAAKAKAEKKAVRRENVEMGCMFSHGRPRILAGNN